MKRYRKVKKYGNSYIISLSRVDMLDFNLEEGDEVDIQDISKKDKKEKKNNEIKNK
jgi:antitoxin component of MazEF toxin-antitoxin module